MARIPLVVGNWKLQNTVAEALALAGAVKDQIAGMDGVEVGVAPVFIRVIREIRGLKLPLDFNPLVGKPPASLLPLSASDSRHSVQ